MKLIAITAAAIFGLVTNSADQIETVASRGDILVGKARATDGDSLRMGDKRIRLYGIDAPESAQTCMIDGEPWTCGRASRKALERLTRGQVLTCRVRDMDRGRYVSTCLASGIDLSQRMVRRGWAVAFTRYSMAYLPDEIAARRDKLALWRSKFERPAAWRASQRKAREASRVPQTPPSADCNIKGNISRSGTRIFHMPGQRDYGRTRINEDNGERWFCTPDNAREAGWRQARR